MFLARAVLPETKCRSGIAPTEYTGTVTTLSVLLLLVSSPWAKSRFYSAALPRPNITSSRTSLRIPFLLVRFQSMNTRSTASTSNRTTKSVTGFTAISSSAPRSFKYVLQVLAGMLASFRQLILSVRGGSLLSTDWRTFATRIVWGTCTICIDMQNEDP